MAAMAGRGLCGGGGAGPAALPGGGLWRGLPRLHAGPAHRGSPPPAPPRLLPCSLPCSALFAASFTLLVTADHGDALGFLLETPLKSVRSVLARLSVSRFFSQNTDTDSSLRRASNDLAKGQGLDAHLRKREGSEYRARGPGGGGFCRAPIDAAAAGLAVRWPGVRHALVPDAAAAGEHVLGLTKALAFQPYKVQV